MKVAIVANSTWNIYNFRQNVIREFLDQGCEVISIAPVDEYIFYKNSYQGLRHIPLNWLQRNGKWFWKDLFLIAELASIYRKERPDLVIHYTVKPNVYGAIAAKLTRAKSVAIITGLGYTFIHNNWISKISRWLYRLTARLNVVHIFENKDDRTLFNRLGIVPKKQSVSIKGCGVDVHHFKPNGVSPDHTGGKVVFSYIGRLVLDKGIKEFVTAAEMVKRHYPQAEFWLVGKIDVENPTAVRHQDLVKWTEQGTIVYKGYTDDVRDWIGLSDCIVLPSYREGMPRTLKEGMAMGKPLITTDTPGCREAVEHIKNGLLVPPKNSRALAEAMLHFIHTPQIEKEKMGKAGRKKAIEEFDDKKIARQIFNIVQKLMVSTKTSN